jgi:hypothetical protein
MQITGRLQSIAKETQNTQERIGKYRNKASGHWSSGGPNTFVTRAARAPLLAAQSRSFAFALISIAIHHQRWNLAVFYPKIWHQRVFIYHKVCLILIVFS